MVDILVTLSMINLGLINHAFSWWDFKGKTYRGCERYGINDNDASFSRSGKSSIQRVVFGKMPPNDTLYLESTTKIQREDIT